MEKYWTDHCLPSPWCVPPQSSVPLGLLWPSSISNPGLTASSSPALGHIYAHMIFPDKVMQLYPTCYASQLLYPKSWEHNVPKIGISDFKEKNKHFQYQSMLEISIMAATKMSLLYVQWRCRNTVGALSSFDTLLLFVLTWSARCLFMLLWPMFVYVKKSNSQVCKWVAYRFAHNFDFIQLQFKMVPQQLRL